MSQLAEDRQAQSDGSDKIEARSTANGAEQSSNQGSNQGGDFEASGWSKTLRAMLPRRDQFTVLTVVTLLFTIWYASIFYGSIQPFWFHAAWTTDDALQQVYPFHEVSHPGLFEGDLITDVMKGYLAPAHYWLCWGITALTGSPIMMAHWVMLIQIVLAVGFLFAAVKYSAGAVPAFISVAWLLHTRHVMQRLTSGLPRGWGAPIFAAFLYFALSNNHIGVLSVILIGCLLNPPATLVVAAAYGMILTWKLLATRGQERKVNLRRFISLAAMAPLFTLIVLVVVHRPPQIGQMVSYDVAATMPEFSRPFGRFPFIPFNPAIDEIRVFGLQAFIGRFYSPGKFWRQTIEWWVLGSLALIVCVGLVRRRRSVPSEVWMFGCGALTIYFMSRILAFRLYVPNRHLQIPLAMFFIAAFCIGAWRAFHLSPAGTPALAGGVGGNSVPERDSRLRVAWPSAIALTAIGALVFIGSNLGLNGAMNFNYPVDKHGGVFEWLGKSTPERALIAGHPTHMDSTQLFAARRAYVTTETTHPFYTRYYDEMKRRSEIALRAHYAESLQELVSLVEPEGINYFVFRRSDFEGGHLAEQEFFPPFEPLMKELTSRSPERYAYRQLPVKVDIRRFPFMPYKDKKSVVVDIKALKDYLARENSANQNH